MSIFKKKSDTFKIPSPFTADDILIESSTCTGKKTIGFYDKSTKKLMYAELVSSDNDIIAFYGKYGIPYSER